MFKVKICGVKDAAIVEACDSAGADAIGLNFYAKSKRYIQLDQARLIAQSIDATQILKVGLFVNHDPTVIVHLAKELELDAVQLHGDENQSVLLDLDELPQETKVIRAIRISKSDEDSALSEICAWESTPNSERIGAFLVDPFVKDTYGGTGQRLDWKWLSELQLPTDKPLILAGGLTAENVSEAISIVQPFGVDVAGGVENEQGKKAPNLIASFAAAARHSFDRV